MNADEIYRIEQHLLTNIHQILQTLVCSIWPHKPRYRSNKLLERDIVIVAFLDRCCGVYAEACVSQEICTILVWHPARGDIAAMLG